MLDSLVEKAKTGDALALDEIVRQLTGPLFALALRMLYHPQDAEDALQEILIRIVTHLGNFKGRSSFRTYAFRIAANHLRTVRCRRREYPRISFEEMGDRIVAERAVLWQEHLSDAQQRIFVREIRLHCVQAMLLALDREHRLAYILGEVFDLTGEQGAAVLEITSGAFRKRLSRARSRLRNFMIRHCAIIRPGNPCRCDRQAAHFSRTGEMTQENLVFARQPFHETGYDTCQQHLDELDELRRVRNLFRACPDLAEPRRMARRIRYLVSSGKYPLLGNSAG